MLQKIARTYNIALDTLMFGEEPKMSSYFVTRAGKGVSIERTRAFSYTHLDVYKRQTIYLATRDTREKGFRCSYRMRITICIRLAGMFEIL